MRKKTVYIVFTAVILTASIFTDFLFAQPGGKMPGSFRMRNQFGARLFQYQVYNLADSLGDEKSRLDFSFSIANDLLTFIKTDENTFTAKYEINLIVYNKKDVAVADKSFKGSQSVNTFAETNSRTRTIKSSLSLSLPPDDYYYIVRIVENDIPEMLVEKTRINLRSFDDKNLQTSDLVFITSLDSTTEPVNYTPSLNDVYSAMDDDFRALMFIYPPQGVDSVHVRASILSQENAIEFKENRTMACSSSSILYTLPIKNHVKKPGQYNLKVAVISGKKTVELDKKFQVQWTFAPVEEENLELAIRQLKLIANKKQIQAIKNAPAAEQEELYNAFWKERDPSPDTPENELKEEFFRRIDFSNQNFAEPFPQKQGWDSDRGQVYIKFGPPTQVERHQADMNSPALEIWYFSKIDRRYYFADRNGDGVFRQVKVE